VSVAAVVLTYNRKELVKKCLQGILRQSQAVDAIVLVDNCSIDGTRDALRDEGYFSDLIHYIYLEENVGSAGGFFIGLQYAYEHGFDWFWLMDDDAVPTPNALKNLFLHTLEHHSAKLGGLISFQTSWTIESLRYRLPKSMLEAFIYGLSCPIKASGEHLIPIDHCILVCLLMPRTVVSHIGLPHKDLYFYSDDFDYTLRIRKAGYHLFIIPDSIVDHRSKITSLSTDKKATTMDRLRWYYLYRNHIATIIAHREFIGMGCTIMALIRVSGGSLKRVFLSCIQRDYKMAALVLKAVIDGYSLHLGKYVPKT
jgi:rhamnopyranosyl-N-acetylglucosaminyl-diphospho-decaprenol beta-1,3/1,4-galactofuranosyltransferase